MPLHTDLVPFGSEHLVLLWGEQAGFGTAVTPTNAVGIVTPDATSDADLKKLFGPGSANALFIRGGIAKVELGFTVQAFQNMDLLKMAVRVNGQLPWLTIGVGIRDDAGTIKGWMVQDCKLGQFDLDVTAEEWVKGSVRFHGRRITELPTVTPDSEEDTPWMCYEVHTTKGGVAYPLNSIKVSVNHNLKAGQYIAGAARTVGQIRIPDYIKEGPEDVNGEITRTRLSGEDMQADYLSGADLVVNITGVDTSATVTAAGAVLGSEKIAGQDRGDVTYTTPFEAISFSVAGDDIPDPLP